VKCIIGEAVEIELYNKNKEEDLFLSKMWKLLFQTLTEQNEAHSEEK
jgi:hypothetical protein